MAELSTVARPYAEALYAAAKGAGSLDRWVGLSEELGALVRHPQVLVLAPTRELAIQVAEAFQTYARHLQHFHVLPIYGGTDYRGQLRSLKQGVQVVVGTPGRVMDHMRRATLDLSRLRALVLDEADEMLRMGFIDDVEWILQQTPAERQIALNHFFHHVFVANRGSNHLDAPLAQRDLEADVAHHRRDHGGSRQTPSFLQIDGAHQQHGVAVDDLAPVIHEQRAIAVAIKGNTKPGLGRDDGPGQPVEMRRTAVEIDVPAVRRRPDGVHVEAQLFEQTRRDRNGRTVGTVDDDLRSGQRSSGLHDLQQMLDVVRRELLILIRPC